MAERLATCCYCGRRTALRDVDHHLVCGSCAAPLTEMKHLKVRQAAAVSSHAPTKVARPLKTSKPKKHKKPKSMWRKVAGEAFDIIEDIFD